MNEKINDIDLMKKELKRLKNIELKYKALLNATPYMAWFTDIDSNYFDVNNEFLVHCGKTIDNVNGKSHKYVWEEKVGNECRTYDLEVLNKRKNLVSEEIVPGKRGYRRFNIYRAPVIDEQDNIIGIIGVGKDITEIKNRDTQFQILIENIPFKVWLRDTSGTYINSNTKFAESRNMDVDKLIGKNISEFYSKEILEEISNEDIQVISTKKSLKFTKDIIKDNKTRSIEIYKTPVLNIANEVIGIVGTIVDITQIKEANSKIKKQAYTDSHTGLLNRRALYEYFNNIRNGSNITAMIIDIDNFKDINDKYGHEAGDRALKRVSKELKKLFSNDYIFRFGGDEFIIIIENIDYKKYIEYKANEILREVYNIEVNEIENDKISLSIGIAHCKCSCDKVKKDCELIKRADMALYKAKEYGKGRYVIYTKGLEDEIKLKINIEKDLNNAVVNDEVSLYYQPQYTKDNKLSGFEALFRWKNKKYSSIPIIDIINIMEKSNLIISIGNEIIRKACLFAKYINKNREDKLIVSFNVSSVQIMKADFIDNIKKILNETKVSPSCIGIEITETVLLENINENIEKIKELKSLGVKIALDDFGTGYSSFNYLLKLPLSQVKIDKNFIMGIKEDKDYINLIKLIIDSSHSLNLDIVAEGVETIEQLNILKDMHIDYVQGYFISQPLEEQDAIALINNEEKL